MKHDLLSLAVIAATIALGAPVAFAGGPAVAENEADVTASTTSDASFWDGAWAGISVGRGNTNFDIGANVRDQDQEILSLDLPDVGAEGSTAGFGVGYDKVFNSKWVAGLQVDSSVTSITNDASIETMSQPTDFKFGYELTQTRNVSGLARVGYLTSDSTMLYGLVGATNATFTADYSVSIDGNEVMSDGYDFEVYGTTLGGGVETRLSDKLSLKLEYRLTKFDSYPLIDAPFEGAQINADLDAEVQVVTTALVMRF